MNKQSADNLPGPGPGRPKGSVNKTTALLKDAILKAAAMADPAATLDAEGTLEGYLKWAAKETPGPFLSLVGKVLPLQVSGGEDGEGLKIIITGVPRAGD